MLALLLCTLSVSALYHYDAGSETGVGTSGALSSNGGAANADAAANESAGGRGMLDVGVKVGSSAVADIATNRVRSHAQTKLNLSVDTTSGTTDARIRARLSNGRFAEIKVMPETASAVAQAQAEARCAEANCSLVLKEVGRGDDARAAYEARVQKDARFLGLFRAKMVLAVLVDAETGDIIAVNRPWWAFLATEARASASTNVGANANATGTSRAGAANGNAGAQGGAGGY